MANQPETALQKRIRERLRTLNLTPYRAAVDHGMKADAIRNLLRPGKVANPRQDTMITLARALDCSVAYLMGQSDEPGTAPEGDDKASPEDAGRFGTFPLTVRFELQAGTWHEQDETAQAPEISSIASSPEWPAAKQWVSRVQGDSMNEFYRPGSFVHVVSVFALATPIVDGDHVQVARRRDGGLIERTLKEVRSPGKDAKYELWPRSTNAKWKEPLILHEGLREEDDDAVVEVEGLVIGNYLPVGRKSPAR